MTNFLTFHLVDWSGRAETVCSFPISLDIRKTGQSSVPDQAPPYNNEVVTVNSGSDQKEGRNRCANLRPRKTLVPINILVSLS